MQQLTTPIKTDGSTPVAGLYAELSDPVNPVSKRRLVKIGSALMSNRDRSMSIKLDGVPTCSTWDGRLYFDAYENCKDLGKLVDRYAGGRISIISGKFTGTDGMERSRFLRIGRVVPTQSDGCVLFIDLVPISTTWTGWALLALPKAEDRVKMKPSKYNRISRARAESERRAAENVGEDW